MPRQQPRQMRRDPWPTRLVGPLEADGAVGVPGAQGWGVTALGSRHGPSPRGHLHPHGCPQCTAEEHGAQSVKGLVLWRPSPPFLPSGGELACSARWMRGWGQMLFPMGPPALWAPGPLTSSSWYQAGMCFPPREPTVLSFCPKEPGAQRESWGLGWASGQARGTRVADQPGELGFRGQEDVGKTAVGQRRQNQGRPAWQGTPVWGKPGAWGGGLTSQRGTSSRSPL